MWLPEDRTVAMVWQQMQRTKCKRCGTWDWEWEENPEAWFADWHVCQGCKQVDSVPELHERQKRNGMQIRLFREES